MTESKVIARTLIYLIKNQGFVVDRISIRTIKERQLVINELKKAGIKNSVINRINKPNGKIKNSYGNEDINGYLTFKQGRPQKRIMIEAKGGNVFYNYYTMLGQFITLKKSPSRYYWFGFALPDTWEGKIKKYMTDKDGKIKSIIMDIIEKYTKNGQGLYFYFVYSNGSVVTKTWKQTLKKNVAKTT